MLLSQIDRLSPGDGPHLDNPTVETWVSGPGPVKRFANFATDGIEAQFGMDVEVRSMQTHLEIAYGCKVEAE